MSSVIHLRGSHRVRSDKCRRGRDKICRRAGRHAESAQETQRSYFDSYRVTRRGDSDIPRDHLSRSRQRGIRLPTS